MKGQGAGQGPGKRRILIRKRHVRASNALGIKSTRGTLPRVYAVIDVCTMRWTSRLQTEIEDCS